MRTSVVLFLVPAIAACLGGEWARVQAEDSPAAYRRFLREHPGSSHAAAARERLAFLTTIRHPSREGLERFRADFPDGADIAALARAVEEAEFERARLSGSVKAYELYLEHFPNGARAERARGNAEYLRRQGFVHRPEDLSAFAERFPNSDYADEARRSLELLALSRRTQVRTVGLRVDVDPATPGAERLVRTFRDHAERAYAEAGLPLDASAEPSARPDAWIGIHHEEGPVGTGHLDAEVLAPGVAARTTVDLIRSGDARPIWAETFGFRGSAGEQRNGDSILFSARAPVFWSRFFVPVARWRTDASRRGSTPVLGDPVDVDLRGGRAVMLFSDGRFRVLDLADPLRPGVIVEYRRPLDLARFDGVRLLDDRVVVFGEGGLEVVQLEAGEARRVRALGREAVGTVRAVERWGSELFVAGSRGLARLRLDGSEALETLFAREVRDLARVGKRIAFLDDGHLILARREQLQAGLADASVRLGRGFDAQLLDVAGGLASVIGALGVSCFDVSSPGAPRALARASRRAIGRVEDAAMQGGRLFLIGERGLLVLDPRSGRVLESVDVAARQGLAAWGRHLVAVGSGSLEVVDATPWISGGEAAFR
jgi:hypothetical protein